MTGTARKNSLSRLRCEIKHHISCGLWFLLLQISKSHCAQCRNVKGRVCFTSDSLSLDEPRLP